jgi:hypothetical protein
VDGAYEEIINPEGNPGCLAYARVSTADQDPHLQIDALTAHGCRRLFVEKISSRTKDRPGLAAALHRLDPNGGVGYWNCPNARPVRGVVKVAVGTVKLLGLSGVMSMV